MVYIITESRITNKGQFIATKKLLGPPSCDMSIASLNGNNNIIEQSLSTFSMQDSYFVVRIKGLTGIIGMIIVGILAFYIHRVLQEKTP